MTYFIFDIGTILTFNYFITLKSLKSFIVIRKIERVWKKKSSNVFGNSCATYPVKLSRCRHTRLSIVGPACALYLNRYSLKVVLDGLVRFTI